MANLLKTAFPHLSDNQIKITVTGLFNLNQVTRNTFTTSFSINQCSWYTQYTQCNLIEPSTTMIPWQDIPGFKEHLRDFLVQIREFTGEDDTDLYLEEREVRWRESRMQGNTEWKYLVSS